MFIMRVSKQMFYDSFNPSQLRLQNENIYLYIYLERDF